MTEIDRKGFIQMTSLSAANLLLKPLSYATGLRSSQFKALAFDAFAIFDPRPVFGTLAELFPEKGKQLAETWQTKQFGYQWLRISGHKYKNFWDVTRDALEFTLVQSQLRYNDEIIEQVMQKYLALPVWPDVLDSLEILKRQGLKICFLSNMTEKMLQQGLFHSGAGKYFDHIISTDAEHTYKPSPDAYQLAAKRLKLRKEEILFVPFASWDMAGAKWFGYPTFWVNRLHATMEQLDAEPDGMGNNLNDLIEFMRK